MFLQYYRSPQPYNDMLTYANTTFTALFTVESILKIIAFGLRVCREGLIAWKNLYCKFHFRIIFVINGMHLILLQYLVVLLMYLLLNFEYEY